jgi:hypothetical protein
MECPVTIIPCRPRQLSAKYEVRESVAEVFDSFSIDVASAGLDDLTDVVRYVLWLTRNDVNTYYKLRHDLKYFLMISAAWKDRYGGSK